MPQDSSKNRNLTDWQRRLFDSLSYPTLILSPDKVVIAANRVFIEQIGMDYSEVLGQSCSDFFRIHRPQMDMNCPRETCPHRKAVKTRTPQSVLIRGVDQNGNDTWEDRVFSPILGDDGEVLYIIESFRDITRLKELEKMYSEMQELIDKVVQSSVSGIMAANRKGEIMMMNKAAEELFGYSKETARKVNIEDYYPPGTARRIMKMLRDETIGGKGKMPATQVNILNSMGEKIPVEMTAAIIYEDDKETATAAIFNDLREKLAVEKTLEEAQKQLTQSEKLASIGRLAAGVAHEINNPLTSILLYGTMMKEKMAEDDPLLSNLSFILEDAERCKEIVKNLLVYSRQETSKKSLFYLSNLVSESLRLIRDQKLFMNVKVEKQISEAPILINADKNQLCQVVINLIINAIDAMEGKGTLTIRVYRNTETEKAFLEISDTGGGIPEEDISKVFDPFFTTKEPGKGTGLGLSMAFGIMEKNNGKITIKETGPSGTTMMLTLPEERIEDEFMFMSIG